MRKYCNFLLIGLFVCIAAGARAQAIPAAIEPSEAVANQMQFIANEASALKNETAELESLQRQVDEQIAKLSTDTVDQVRMEQAELQLDTQKVALESVELTLKSARQTLEELTSAVAELEEKLQILTSVQRDSYDRELIADTRASLDEKRILLTLQKQRIEQLDQRGALENERYKLAERWFQAVKNTYRDQQAEARKLTLEELEKELVIQQQGWQLKANDARNYANQLRDTPEASQSAKDLVETRLVEAEESVFLINVQRKMATIRTQLDKLRESDNDSKSLRGLRSTTNTLETMGAQLGSIKLLLDSKADLALQRRQVILKGLDLERDNRKEYREVYSIFNGLIGRFEQQKTALKTLASAVEEERERIRSIYLERKKRGLSERHQLPRTLQQWEALLAEIHRLPEKLLQLGRNIILSMSVSLEQADLNRWLLLLLPGILWALFCLLLGKLKPSPPDIQDRSFTQRAVIISTALVRRSRFDLLLSGLLLIASWVLDIVPPGFLLVASVVAIWLSARLIIGLAWWVLVSPLGLEGQHTRLFRLVVLFTLLHALLALGLTLGYLELISQELRELFERFFMFFLLPPAFLALRIRNLWYGMLKERKGNTHWVRLMGLAGLAIPLAIAVAALMGIFGYINFAWTLGAYLALSFAVITGWMIARGLILDLAQSVEKVIASRTKQANFWVKSLIEPIQYLIRLGLFLTAVWLLYRLLVEDPATGLDLRSWLSHTLFTLGEKPINSIDLLSSAVLLFLVFYVGRWAREVTYGWVYAKIKDIGIRNSLSVFTQYAVVVIGLLVALNIMGINLTSLAVFAGALGVGIGFGMQNIANNFISGLILLAERPVRTRDWVTIGDKEGTVAEIGMRSVTVTTWDNQDVIIPNSDLISNSFINWTRSDTEVRTVLLIGVSYNADPNLAQQVILDAVTMQPEVSLAPRGPQVWLVDFAASSVNFRIQFFTDVLRFSRLEVQSKVLFAIWNALKEAEIEIPFPQQDVYIKSLPQQGGGPKPE